jgi:uncharacterized protein (TIGR02145 family)
MKNVMKKQCEKFPLWGCKMLLMATLSSLGVDVFAQTDVCAGTAYTINSAMDASGASTYQWLLNGQVISGAKGADYTVSANLAAGYYAFIRQAKSADCNEWQSSNEFVVRVFNCSFTAGTETGATATFTDPRDGKRYKTVVMPDGKTWFAQNLNYTKDLTYNTSLDEANDKPIIGASNGVKGIGSYWCPGQSIIGGNTFIAKWVPGSEADCNTYGALYGWETALMVDGKYADEAKTDLVWNESWTAQYISSGAPAIKLKGADVNIGRGTVTAKSGGRGICPLGWHVPTLMEWATLLDNVDGDGTGDVYRTTWNTWTSPGTDNFAKLKSPGTYSHTASAPRDGRWDDRGIPRIVNGFNALPAGYAATNSTGVHGLGRAALFHSSSIEWYNVTATIVLFDTNPAAVLWSLSRLIGTSVRCISD